MGNFASEEGKLVLSVAIVTLIAILIFTPVL